MVVAVRSGIQKDAVKKGRKVCANSPDAFGNRRGRAWIPTRGFK